MLTIVQAIILGIVEGITEFLPISSTGHLILVTKFLHISETNFSKSFDIIIQLGAIIAVILLYGKKVILNKKYFYRVCVAFIPTGIIGFLIYKVAKQYLLGNARLVIYTLFIGGVLIILFEKIFESKKILGKNIDEMTYFEAVIIGLVQSLAIIPGVSRAAATILGGLFMGFDRKAIVEFSFLLAIPTMLAATVFDLYKNGSTFNSSEFASLGVGFVVSFITAFITVKWLIKFIKTHNFKLFGIYRIVISVLAFFIL